MEQITILEMQHVTKKFPGVIALNDVSIQLRKGEILSICGGNGAGKSTLMKILAGEYAYGTYTGEIVLDGKKQKLISNHAAEVAGIAMIYQEINVELDLSIAENILLGCLPKTKLGLIDWKKTQEIAMKTLQRLDVHLDVTLPMRQLNASVQQLVCIARALVRDPKILILDEPTAALTESETKNLLQVLQNLKSTGISCIYISHKLDEVFRISDRVIVMRDAKVISNYEKEEIDPDAIIADMVGRKLGEMYPSMDERILGEEVLRVENVTVPHPHAAKNIIENANFFVRKGEIVGLAGLVGSGRSELLRAIFGVLPKASGEIYVEGKKCKISSAEEGIRCGLGFLTEERKKDGVVGSMDIRENMTLAILNRISRGGVIRREQENERVAHYFKSLNIKAASPDINIMTLSGGNQQKVVLAKSLLTEMKVLFLDEPTRGIDIGAKAEIYRIMKELVEQGMSIIMISSELPELLAMCDRFVILGNGKIVGELSKEEANEELLIKMASGITVS